MQHKLYKPEFIDVPYDMRNNEKAGFVKGVGHKAKVGSRDCTSYDPMPPKKAVKKVPRDYEN